MKIKLNHISTKVLLGLLISAQGASAQIAMAGHRGSSHSHRHVTTIPYAGHISEEEVREHAIERGYLHKGMSEIERINHLAKEEVERIKSEISEEKRRLASDKKLNEELLVKDRKESEAFERKQTARNESAKKALKQLKEKVKEWEAFKEEVAALKAKVKKKADELNAKHGTDFSDRASGVEHSDWRIKNILRDLKNCEVDVKLHEALHSKDYADLKELQKLRKKYKKMGSRCSSDTYPSQCGKLNARQMVVCALSKKKDFSDNRCLKNMLESIEAMLAGKTPMDKDKAVPQKELLGAYHHIKSRITGEAKAR